MRNMTQSFVHLRVHTEFSLLDSVVRVPELMQATKLAFSRSFDFQVYIWAAVLYLIMVEAIRRLWGVLERYLTRHLRRRPAPTRQPAIAAAT